jgi:hypothetical protein
LWIEGFRINDLFLIYLKILNMNGLGIFGVSLACGVIEMAIVDNIWQEKSMYVRVSDPRKILNAGIVLGVLVSELVYFTASGTWL